MVGWDGIRWGWGWQRRHDGPKRARFLSYMGSFVGTYRVRRTGLTVGRLYKYVCMYQYGVGLVGKALLCIDAEYM